MLTHLQQTVSIIDDDASVREAVSSLLRSLGLLTRIYDSAEAFLAGPGRHDSDCVIADVQMPGMSGLELQETLRAAGSTLPMIFITAFPDPAIRRRAFAGRASCFMGKPFDAQDMIRCIVQALGRDHHTD